LDTTSAGAFNGSASVSFASHNAEMADLDLGSQSVVLMGQVNNFAQAAFGKSGGDGSFSGAGTIYMLNFGSVVAGAAGLSAELEVLNTATSFADALRGSFDLGSSSLTDNFTFAGFEAFADLAAGSAYGGLTVNFASTFVGDFDQVIVLRSTGTNASGYEGSLGDIQLHLQGSVAAVPEPETYMLMAGGLITIWLARRRSLRPSRLRVSG